MEPIKVGIGEFRSQLPHYLLKAGQAVAITRHGETIGYYIPNSKKFPQPDTAAMKAAAAKLDAMLKTARIDTEEVVAEYTARKRKKSKP